MKNTLKYSGIMIPVLIVLVVPLLWNKKQTDQRNAVNPVLGDISFEAMFDKLPDATTDEDLRIRTHLAYVEDLLRKKDVSHLTNALQEKRAQLLELLQAYRSRGIFPRNYDYKDQRQPCFIDKNGTICAVGYLIEQTAGRSAAEEINAAYKYEKLMAIKSRTVDEWIALSGLSKEECAMIQPAYGPAPDNSTYINTGHAFLSGGLTGINLGLTTLNIMNTARGNRKQFFPNASIIIGLGQFVVGGVQLVDYSGYSRYGGNYFTAMTKLGMMNITIGTATALIGTFTAVSNKNHNNKSVGWNIYGYPATNGQLRLGFYCSKTF